MKKTFFFLLTALLLVPLSSFAFQSQAGETLSITTPITQDFYAAGGNITIATSASNDLTLVGGKNFINSAITQDLTVVGGDVIVNGSVGETAKIAGGNVTINSAIHRDLFVGGGNITLSPTASVLGDTLIAGGLIRMEGTINNANLNASQIIIQGTIRGNAVLRAEQIQVVPGARILGNLEYHANQKNMELEQIVSGMVSFKEIPLKTGGQFLWKALTGYLAFGFLFLAFFGILLFYLGRDRFVKPIKSFKEGPWSSLGYGFLVYAAIPLSIILLMMSFVGIPFGFLLIAIYACLFIFYKLFNVIFYSHLLVDRIGGMKKVKTWKKIGIILLCAILSACIATIDLILAFFALGATLKAYLGKSKK